MKTYILYVTPYGPSAKNRGIVGAGRNERGVVRFAFRAEGNEEAYAHVCREFLPGDRRPLAGKSYVRPRRYRVGDRVTLVAAYPPGCGAKYSQGLVSEVLGPERVSVELPGYHTRFVDFHVFELA